VRSLARSLALLEGGGRTSDRAAAAQQAARHVDVGAAQRTPSISHLQASTATPYGARETISGAMYLTSQIPSVISFRIDLSTRLNL